MLLQKHIFGIKCSVYKSISGGFKGGGAMWAVAPYWLILFFKKPPFR